MLHTIAHFASLVASAFSFICAAILVFLIAITVTSTAEERRNFVWGIPAVVIGLGVFWAAAAYGLHAL